MGQFACIRIQFVLSLELFVQRCAQSRDPMTSQKPQGRKAAITMEEIARMAGVSQSTVSRVLNGTVPVAPEKQAAVLAVMEQLNYRPNLAAQGLVSGKTSTIGVMTRHLGSPFYG